MASTRLSSALATLRRNSGPSTSLASPWILPVISIARHSSISTVSNLSYCSKRRSFKERSNLITDTIRSPVITASEVASHRPKVPLGCRAAVKPQGVMPPPRVGPRHSKMPASEQRLVLFAIGRERPRTLPTRLGRLPQPSRGLAERRRWGTA